jgi:hypothetical protein
LIQSAKGDYSEDWRLPNSSTKFKELLARVYRKDHKKRSVGKILFSLGDRVKFGDPVYNIVRYTAIVMLAHNLYSCVLLA